MRRWWWLAILGLALAGALLSRREPAGGRPRPVRVSTAEIGIPQRREAGARTAAAPSLRAPHRGVLVSNGGQLDPRVRFALRDRNVSVFFTDDGVTLAAVRGSRGIAVRHEFVGGRATEPEALGTAGTSVNSYVGDPSRWRTELPSCERLIYREVWPCVDVLYEPVRAGWKYTVVVRPGGDPGAVRFAYRGVEGLSAAGDDRLLVRTEMGELEDSGLQTFQDRDIPSAFRPAADGTYGFEVGSYDPTQPLIIDPTLTYFTYLGWGNGSQATGNEDWAKAVAVDGAGSVYVAGHTDSDFPVSPGAYDLTNHGSHDFFVCKLTLDGNALVWSTYLGGSSIDFAETIAVDASGGVYVGGRTLSSDFPTTPGALDTVFSGISAGVVVRLSPDGGTLVWSTFLGGSGSDAVYDLVLDSSGNAYATGMTDSADFPTTPGAYDTTPNGGTDAFVARLSAGGSTLDWSTLLGGSVAEVGFALVLDAAGAVTVAGYTTSANFPVTPGALDTTANSSADIFISRVVAGGGSLAWSTFLGGGLDDYALDVALDSSGNVCVGGYTSSSNFPTTPGAYDTSWNGGNDAFVAKVTSDGSAFVWSTVIGGFTSDYGYEVHVAASGNVRLAGTASSADFPTTAGVYDPSQNGGEDVFVLELDASGAALVWSTFLGGSGTDKGLALAADGAGNLYVAGTTESTSFPATAGSFDSSHNGGKDAFLAKLTPGGVAISWSTFLGGASADFGIAMAVDLSGNAYLVGRTTSIDFPTTAGAFDTGQNGQTDVFVTKMDAGGAFLSWSTFLGGAGNDRGLGLAIDASGNVFVTGSTDSADFPTTAGAFDPSLNGFVDAFVTKLNAGGGSIAWSTLLGGSGGDYGVGLALDPSGNVCVAGSTWSADFPVTAGAFDTTYAGFFVSDGFVAKLGPGGDVLMWSTYLGGTEQDLPAAVAADASGAVIVAGSTMSLDFPTTIGAFDVVSDWTIEAFVTKIAPGGGSLEWSTLLGESGDDYATSLAVDGGGNVYVTGYTDGPDFPTTAGAFDTIPNGGNDAFVARIEAGGATLGWSTFLGGSGYDYGMALDVDAAGNVFVAGYTLSADFPITPGAYDPTFNGLNDAFVTKVDAGGATLGWSTYLGGTGDDLGTALRSDASGNVRVTGYTTSPDFPVFAGIFDPSYNGSYDAFLARLGEPAAGGGSPGATKVKGSDGCGALGMEAILLLLLGGLLRTVRRPRAARPPTTP